MEEEQEARIRRWRVWMSVLIPVWLCVAWEGRWGHVSMQVRTRRVRARLLFEDVSGMAWHLRLGTLGRLLSLMKSTPHDSLAYTHNALHNPHSLSLQLDNDDDDDGSVTRAVPKETGKLPLVET